MDDEPSILKERVERLRRIYLKAIAAFNAFEQIQEYRAPNLHGQELAHKHAQAMGAYKGFFNAAENALNTELHIALAKLFDSHKNALHIGVLASFSGKNTYLVDSSSQVASAAAHIAGELRWKLIQTGRVKYK